jgi:hypothetical protein
MITKFRIFEQKEEDWKLILDISNIWTESLYSNNEELIKFNEEYINFLNSNKNLITEKTSSDEWIILQELISKLTENKSNINESIPIWDNIYDWADDNLIEIKADKNIQKDF